MSLTRVSSFLENADRHKKQAVKGGHRCSAVVEYSATIVQVETKRKTPRISIALLFEALRVQCDLVADTKHHHAELVDERNQMMVELKAAGLPDSRLVRITGLSLSTVTKITAGARRGWALPDLETRDSPRLRPQGF